MFVQPGVERQKKKELQIGSNDNDNDNNNKKTYFWHFFFRLLRAAEEALIEGSNEHLNIVKEIRDDHINAARSFVKNPEILKELEDRLEKECLRLKSFLEAAEVNK